VALNHFFPELHVSPAAFAIAGMGGVVGGTTGAALAAIVMIFEMTLDYTVIIPLTLTVAISYGIRRSLIKDSVYTRKLTLRGEPVPESMRADVQQGQRAAGIMHPAKSEVLAAMLKGGGDGVPKDFVTVPGDASLWEVIARMHASDASVALVTSKGSPLGAADVQGMITRKDILDTLADDMELFSD
jgi:CIC family chloride channel protein